MSPLEITLIVIASMLLIMWIAITAAVMVLVWRVGKIVVGFTVALRGATELLDRFTGLGTRAERLKHRFHNRGI